MAIKLLGYLSGLIAETRAGNNASDPALVVSQEATLARAGFGALAVVNDEGSIVSGGIRRRLRASSEGRLTVGIDTPFWRDVFQYTTINASAYSVTTATMTITQANGLLNLNAGASVTTAQSVNWRTWRTFDIVPTSALVLEFSAIGINQTALNAQCDVGLGYAVTTGTPTDGVFFRWGLDGTLKGVVNNNGTETLTADLTKVADNARAEYRIIINDENAEFWINGVLRATLSAVSTYTGHGIVQSSSLPLMARLFNSGTASAAKRLGISEVGVFMADVNSNRLWATQQTGMELSSIQSPPGAAAAQLANYANSAAPTSATLSNTAAGYTTLGGQFQFAAVAGAETDYALFAYQVPAGSVTQPGKNLVLRGIWIETFNTVVAVATTATVMQWALGVGSSAVSLATTDSLTAAGKAPRRVSLGTQSFPVGAAVGAEGKRIDVNLDAPLVVAPGSFVHVILKMPIATATATEIFRGIVGFNGYFE